MQPDFPSSLDTFVIEGVLNQIRLAKRRKAGIVIIEYIGSGKTGNRILKSLTTYQHVICVKKSTNDGSRSIVNAISKHNFSKQCIRLCGVNTGACVFQTAIGLSNKFPKTIIEFVENACNDDWHRDAKPSDMLKAHYSSVWEGSQPHNFRVI